MKLTRRAFINNSASFLLLTMAGCERLPWGALPGWLPTLTEEGRFQAPQNASIDLIAHVLNRTSFGMRGRDYARVKALAATPEAAIAAYLEEQFSPETLDDTRLSAHLRRIEVIHEPLGELYEYKEDYLDRQLIRATLMRAIYSRRQLYEVMVQFWTDHFNIDTSKGECKWLKAADDREVIRRYAFGRFPELLRATALSPAMLWYLDGRVNRKQQDASKPNENYARELLELHTLGVHGGYQQSDVMEVARCLTGWTVRQKNQFRKGKVEFHADLHDDGEKRVLGQIIPAGLGKGDIDRVLAIVALHPATAQNIATKLCQRFIADDPPADAVRRVAHIFRQSEGDMKQTLRALFALPAFLHSRGNKFRRPFEYIAAALRITEAETDCQPALLDYLTRMGHLPFHFPTPDGYPLEATPWLGSLLWRWHFAVALVEGRIAGTRFDLERLRQAAGGVDGVIASLLGRQPNAAERESYGLTAHNPTLVLAAPAFQYY